MNIAQDLAQDGDRWIQYLLYGALAVSAVVLLFLAASGLAELRRKRREGDVYSTGPTRHVVGIFLVIVGIVLISTVAAL